MKLEVKNGELFLGGERFRLLSGTMHYFRVHRSQWKERLQRLKECGLNTVETYIPWNITEPKKGCFCTEGIADFEEFIRLAQAEGLYMIVRPGPYICAEWEMGGLPPWLLTEEGIVLRHYNDVYLKYVKRYFEFVADRIRPYLSTNGGNIIAIQVENEYGGYHEPDTKYLEWIRDTYRELGLDVLYFTSDGTWDSCLEEGSLPGTLMTANFGSRTKAAFERLEALRPGEPKICMEFWNGWFDQWGTEHHTRNAAEVIAELDTLLKLGGHFNLYMASGGTNFGFTNGSNCNPDFEPCITSYDYGAPIAEDGELTEHYRLLKGLLTGNAVCDAVHNTMAYGEIKDFERVGLFTNSTQFGSVRSGIARRTMEEIGQYYGYILYEADISGMSGVIDIGEPHDRAMFYADNSFLGAYERGREYEPISVAGASRLKILIENMGRVNYGPHIYDKKGLMQDVKIGDGSVTVYDISDLAFESIPKASGGAMQGEPSVYYANIDIEEPTDTYFYPRGFTHGIVFVNGFNLGRYRAIGPQQTLYVPAGVLKAGKNEIAVIDLYDASEPSAELLAAPILDKMDR